MCFPRAASPRVRAGTGYLVGTSVAEHQPLLQGRAFPEEAATPFRFGEWIPQNCGDGATSRPALHHASRPHLSNQTDRGAPHPLSRAHCPLPVHHKPQPASQPRASGSQRATSQPVTNDATQNPIAPNELVRRNWSSINHRKITAPAMHRDCEPVSRLYRTGAISSRQLLLSPPLEEHDHAVILASVPIQPHSDKDTMIADI